MNLIFVDHNPGVILGLQQIFPQAEARCCTLNEVPLDDFDVLLTPGNSFGFMDGGFDLAVRNRFPEVEPAVQSNIKKFYYGMLNVGQAFTVHSGNGKFVTYAPTMRVPEPIVGTDNVYWAFRAALMAVRALSETRQIPPLQDARILTPAFGTHAGQMTIANAGHQMRLAFEHVNRTEEQIEQAHTWRGGWDDHGQIRKYR